MEALAEHTQQETSLTPPLPGQPWPEQGGRYAGAYVKDGKLYHGIFADGIEHDVKASFNTLDGKIKKLDEIGGFADWRAPDQREGMLCFIADPDNFIRQGCDSIYLTSTPCGSSSAWIVDFEGGSVYTSGRHGEFRFRPFRSVLA